MCLRGSPTDLKHCEPRRWTPHVTAIVVKLSETYYLPVKSNILHVKTMVAHRKQVSEVYKWWLANGQHIFRFGKIGLGGS